VRYDGEKKWGTTARDKRDAPNAATNREGRRGTRSNARREEEERSSRREREGGRDAKGRERAEGLAENELG